MNAPRRRSRLIATLGIMGWAALGSVSAAVTYLVLLVAGR